MNEKLQQRLSRVECIIKTQRNYTDNPYQVGLLNGLLLAHGIVADTHVHFADIRKRRTRIRHKSNKYE